MQATEYITVQVSYLQSKIWRLGYFVLYFKEFGVRSGCKGISGALTKFVVYDLRASRQDPERDPLQGVAAAGAQPSALVRNW